ncbi:ATP-binding protein [Streptomyces sp. NBC_00028]|uniref:ATP-binding protein n=1 Tax=Streptomyces sp. NBC_00028 TaxID=2975624 RepID=UPI003249466D
MSPAAAVSPADAKPGSLTLRSFEADIDPDPVHVADTRHRTATAMQQWDVSATLAEDVVVVVSELVTNAIEHGHGTVRLRVIHDDGELRIEVTDDNPTPAQLGSASGLDESGRGLLLVAVLARDWGVGDGGRTTWATFRAAREKP